MLYVREIFFATDIARFDSVVSCATVARIVAGAKVGDTEKMPDTVGHYPPQKMERAEEQTSFSGYRKL